MSDPTIDKKAVQYEYMYGYPASQAIRSFPVGYLPIGCLERHGDHLPMGLDTIKAHKVCCTLAREIGGIVFPPHHYAGIHHMSADQLAKYTGEWGNIYTDNTAEVHLVDIITQIALVGIKVLVLYSGHCPPPQNNMLHSIATHFDHHPTITVLPFYESMLVPGDHAGLTETSFMLHLDPSLVDMTSIREQNYHDHGWNEQNAPDIATPERGREYTTKVIDHLRTKIENKLGYK
jgi:creatinine amidohydrolase